MGTRGPKPRPTAEKIAKGERRPSRVNYDEPDYATPSSLKAPAGMKGAGLTEWKRIAPLLEKSGVLRVTDLAHLEDYCRALNELRHYEQLAQKGGAELAIAKGYQGMVVKLRAQVVQLRRELGLTPSSRSGVKAGKPSLDADTATPEQQKAHGYLRGIDGGKAKRRA